MRPFALAGLVLLGSAAGAHAGVTRTGATTIHGDVGAAPGTSITGFPPGIVTLGTTHAGKVGGDGVQQGIDDPGTGRRQGPGGRQQAERQGGNVFFQVGSSATLGTGTVFTGTILAAASITLDAGTVIRSGRALARDGTVTLSSNDVSVGPDAHLAAVPEPAAAAMLGMGVLMALAGRRPNRSRTAN